MRLQKGRDRTSVLEWAFPYLLQGINYENETYDKARINKFYC